MIHDNIQYVHLSNNKRKSVCVCKFYPMPDSSLKKRKKPYPWAKEERKAKIQFIANATIRQRRRPTLSARPPHKNAPTIMLRKTTRPVHRDRDRDRDTENKMIKCVWKSSITEFFCF